MTDRPLPSTRATTGSVAAAHRALDEAAILREDAKQYPYRHHGSPEATLAQAGDLEAAALAFVHDHKDTASNRPLAPRRRSARVAAIADAERVSLASEARSDELAIDMAESLEAANSAELALAHQMAAAHALALRLAGRANLEIEGLGQHNWQRKRETMVEIARLSNSAARLMETYQRALFVLAKVRDGGKQPLVLQRVQINDGGQAVVAGQVSASGGGASE